MAKRAPADPPLCQPYLILLEPAWQDPAGLADLVRRVEAASVLLSDVSADEAGRDAAEAAIRSAQEAGAAVLVEDNVALAVALGADGVHLAAGFDLADRVAAARARDTASETTAPLIVGGHGGTERHGALEASDAGADYLAFDAGTRYMLPGVGDDEPSVEADETLVAWWAGVTEVPVVAWGATDANAVATARSDYADFVAIRIDSPISAEIVAHCQALIAAGADSSEQPPATEPG